MAKAESEENIRDVLLSRCGSESGAFALFYDIYYERIFSYCVSRVHARQIAEDFTGATFLAAAENASKFRGKTRTEFADWLYAIATAKINQYLGKKQTVEKLISAQAQNLQPGTVTWPTLHIAILKLAPREQTVIALRFFENLSIDRIAGITGLKPNAVRLRIAKAIENIKICNTEKQFTDIVKGLRIDNTPDAAHREKLRTKILISFNSAGGKKYQAVLYFFGAAIILIAAGLALWIYSGGGKPLSLLKTVKLLPMAPEVNPTPLPVEKTRLEKIKQLAAEKNITGLLEILKGDDFPAKLLAAKYLAELTDSNVADVMKLAVPERKPAAQKIERQKTLSIRAIDKKTKLPLAQVRLRIGFDGGGNMPDVSTDSNGQFILTLPAEPLNHLQIRAAVKGYAPMKIQRQMGLTMPRTISFEMSRVLTIGGLVVNEQLKAVENAETKVRIESDSNSESPVADIDEIFKTDANGTWLCRDFPQDACQAQICVTHPDYISQDNFQPAVIEQLKSFSYLTILEKGVVVTGIVLDWNKKPLSAVVGRGTYYESRNSVICDVNGGFRFGSISEGKEIFTAQCSGASPQIQQVDVGPNTPPIVFNLEPAKTIRAKVVDIDGVPLKDVSVKVSSWQGFSSLDYETTTDANGFFRWTDAPTDKVLFDLYKPDYKPISNFEMTSENDYVITLEFNK